MRIEAKDIAVALGGKPVLRGVGLVLQPGELVGLIGPNGAGKTTLLRILADMLPHEGSVLYDGEPARVVGQKALARRLAFLAQGGAVHWQMLVQAVVALGRLPHRRPFAGVTAPDIRELIRTQLLIETTQWNLGTFGAIAELMRDPDEPATLIDEPGRLATVTARGGIGFGDLAQLRPFASESVVGAGWSHRVSLCLPAESCAMNRRTVLTELGRDGAALRAEDRDGLLFDMGLGTLQVDVCIRTADPGLIATLRSFAGRPLLEPGNPAMGAIVAVGPHRVFIARPGRCEVYQPIPPADGRSPEGPHTNVLPRLLAAGRTHAATEPVRMVSCPARISCPLIRSRMRWESQGRGMRRRMPIFRACWRALAIGLSSH